MSESDTFDYSQYAPPPIRCDGWTFERQLEFLEALAEHGNVTRAAAAVSMSPSSAYRRRARAGGDAFVYGWRAAQAMAYYRLRDIALDRIANGVVTVQRRGEVETQKTVFSDRLLIAMLDHLKPVPGEPGADGARRPAPDPAAAYAATLAAYDTAIETGDDPKVPTVDDGLGRAVAEPMSRAEFMAAIEARPRTQDLERLDRAALSTVDWYPAGDPDSDVGGDPAGDDETRRGRELGVNLRRIAGEDAPPLAGYGWPLPPPAP